MEKIYFRAFGCPTNFAESDAMQSLMRKAKFEIAKTPEDAIAMVFSICTVKGNTVPLREIRKAREEYPHKKIVVAGCITKDIIPEIKSIDSGISLISTHNIKEIVSVVEETINDNAVDVIAENESPAEKASIPRDFGEKIAIIPISSGCSGKCSYCSVRLVKGSLVSYPMEKILEQCRKAVLRGAREIWVTSQDTASYMLDTYEKTRLPELVEQIASIPGNFMIRIGMMNIDNLIPVIEKMISAMKNEKVFKFIHLPVQSGSDRILKKMRRKYISSDFESAIKKLRDSIPEITVSTDIITGFPGETIEDFNASKAIIDSAKPDILNVSKFRPRPGTEAASMECQVSGDEAKQRSIAITSLFEWSAYIKNKQWLNWAGKAIIEEIGKEGTSTVTARNPSYKPIIIDNKLGNLNVGDIVKVKITGCSKHDLKGELV